MPRTCEIGMKKLVASCSISKRPNNRNPNFRCRTYCYGKYKQLKLKRVNDCTYGFRNDQKYKNNKKLHLRKNKTWLVKHFCSNPYNNTHDFEQGSQTFQQI